MDISDEKLEEVIEEKVKERVEERMKEERQKIKKELKQQMKGSGKVSKSGDNKMTRRKFLKLLGVGAGGLALSSSVAGSWSIVRPSTQGTSDINAEAASGLKSSVVGDGLKNGQSSALSVEPADFAGSGLQDDGSDNLALSNDSISVGAGDGLRGGGSVALGGSTTLNIEPVDFAGSGLQDDGNDNLEVDIDTGVSIREDGSIVVSLTDDVNFSTGITAIDDGDGTASITTNAVVTQGYDLSTVSYNNKSLSVSYNISGGEFGNNGKKFYATSYYNSETVYEYTLSRAYEIETASLVNTLGVGSEDNEPVGVTFNDTGSKMYLAGRESDTIYSYDLSTPYNISTASYSDSYSVGGEVLTLESVTFNESGSKMYVSDSGNNDVESYTLSTSYDISTASPHNTLDVSSYVTQLYDLAFGNGGETMSILSYDNTVYGYKLSTPYDISTASQTNSYSISSQTSNPFGLMFNQIGTRMYVADYSNQSVYEYTAGSIGTGYQ